MITELVSNSTFTSTGVYLTGLAVATDIGKRIINELTIIAADETVDVG